MRPRSPVVGAVQVGLQTAADLGSVSFGLTRALYVRWLAAGNASSSSPCYPLARRSGFERMTGREAHWQSSVKPTHSVGMLGPVRRGGTLADGHLRLDCRCFDW
jgi:hypothetical protein